MATLNLTNNNNSINNNLHYIKKYSAGAVRYDRRTNNELLVNAFLLAWFFKYIVGCNENRIYIKLVYFS